MVAHHHKGRGAVTRPRGRFEQTVIELDAEAAHERAEEVPEAEIAAAQRAFAAEPLPIPRHAAARLAQPARPDVSEPPVPSVHPPPLNWPSLSLRAGYAVVAAEGGEAPRTVVLIRGLSDVLPDRPPHTLGK